jgi:hypothetical protein
MESLSEFEPRSQQNVAAAFLQHFDYAVFCMAAARPCNWGQASNYWVLKKPNISEDFAYLLSTLLLISCIKYLGQNSDDMEYSDPASGAFEILRFTL